MNAHGHEVILPLTGHGVGELVHEPPYIFNYGHPDTKRYARQPGMVVALEPITAISSSEYVEDQENGWNLYTAQGDL